MSLVSARAVRGYDRRQSSSTSQKLLTLPKIEHPSKRFDQNEKNSLDIRGRSRDGEGNGKLIRNESPRRSSSFKYHSKPAKYAEHLNHIPEKGETFSGEDRENVRLPIFGRRENSSSSSLTDHTKERESPRKSKLVIDELERIFKDKVRSQINDIRAKFRHAARNDSNGKINRAALQHLIATILGTQRQISPNQLEKLLERIHLQHSNQISFDEFIQALFNQDDDEELPDWVSHRSPRREESSSQRTAAQIFLLLKAKVRNKDKDLVRLVPSINGGPSSRIFKAQFHNALIDMGYPMKDTEFDKLWDKFDTDGFKAINSEKFLKILTNESVGEESMLLTNREEFDEHSSPSSRSTNVRSSHSDTLLKTPRLNTSRTQLDENQIQNWLNHKFPHGYSDLEKALERLDTKQMGTLPRDRFLQELKRFGLTLEPQLLEFFLKRLNIDLSLTNDGVPYHDVINAFKEKSDPTRKRINADNHLAPGETRQTALERQIDFALSMNYERVRDLLNRLDISQHGRISANEIRSIIEDLINYTLKADEYYQLLKQIPMDEDGRILYKEYLKQVLDRTLQLQEQQQPKSSRIAQYEFSKPINIREKINPEKFKEKKREKEQSVNNDADDDQQRTRSIDQLGEMLKSLIRNRYKDIEEEFKKLDRASYGELTPDLLYHLFQRLSLQPQVTRAEVDLIWSRCHLKRDGNLDFYQFLREFGYSKRSAHYPNAKQNPPKRGDADFVLTSNRLYADTVLVRGAVLHVIRSKWNELRREFSELDPFRTGYVQSDEFDEILTELCPSVNQEDLEKLKVRFQTPNDSRINYVRFLKHHAPLPELIALLDESNRNTLPPIHDKSPRAASDRSVFPQLSNKLRRKLSDSYKQLRRTFKQQDSTNSGSVPVKAFKDILNQHNCPLNDEEFYTLTSQMDTKMDGTINYNYFLQQYVKSV